MAGEPTILIVERHRVRSGESLDSIARSAGLTWQALATFNWGTAVPDEINLHLRDDVGCTKKAADGVNYVFTSFDRPGILLVPRPWDQSGLRTDRVHQVKVEPLMLVVDYEFRHDGDNTNLSFTVRGRQPDKLFVRLYECATLIDANAREAAIRSHADTFQDKSGYTKSGRYREVQDGDSVESLAAAHGISDVSGIREHFENQLFQESRGDGFSVETGDFLFIPQIDATGDPVPLGELLAVSPAEEQVKGGQRYTAVWNNVETGYDPLDWTSWMPETPSSIPILRNLDFPADSAPVLYVPQFAVLTANLVTIGVSPAPMWLVHLSQLEKPSESDTFHAFLAGDVPRPMTETTAEFEGPEEPLTFYSALDAAGDSETET
jgi:hypothetical protein